MYMYALCYIIFSAIIIVPVLANIQVKMKLLYFDWSPPWHLYILLLTNLLAVYLSYLLAFDLAFYLAYLLTFYLAFYLAYLLTFYLAYLLAYLLAFYLANLLAFYLANILALYLAYLLAFYLTFYLAYLLAYLLAFYLANILALIWHIFWHSIWHSIWRSIWHIFWHSIWPLRSSGAHWARKVPGWGPAVPTGLGRSLVEVQRCPLRSEPCGWGPAVPTQIGSRQLRSSSAHCAQKLAKSWQGGSGRGSWCRHGRGETGEAGGGGGGGQQLW